MAIAGKVDGLNLDKTPSSTSTVPNKYSHLVTQAERAAGGFGCNIHLLLRSQTPPKVREADFACSPKVKICSSRVLEAEIAKNRSALAKALADGLLEGLWHPAKAQSGSNSSGSNCNDASAMDSSNSQCESPPDSQPSSTGTPPTNLLTVAERAAEYFGCDLGRLLRSATPPTVDEADVTCSLNERCTSRVLEEAIAKARAGLANALADVLLEALWQSTRSTSNVHDGTDDSSGNWHSESTGQGTGQSGQQLSPGAKERDGNQEFPPSEGEPPLAPSANDEPRLTHWLGQVGKAQTPHQAHRDPIPPPPPIELTGGNTLGMKRTQSPAHQARGSTGAPPSARRATFTPNSFRGGIGGLAAKVPPTVTVATFLKTARDARAFSATTGGAFALASDVPIRFTATNQSDNSGRGTAASEDDAERWVLNGRYEFISRLDPSGALWRVAHLCTGEPLAVKIVPRGRLMHRRFSGHPRSVLDLFQHPNTVPLYEVIDDPCCNNIFLVTPLPQQLPFSLELTSGHVTGNGPAVETILTYAKAAASALAVFHAAGIVHCDIKLENLLLLPQEKAAEEKPQPEHLVIAEFAACQLDVNLAKAGGHMCLLSGRNDGTLAYWAPECFAAKKTQSNPFTAASDCYALGLCLYVMAFGQFPYWTTDATSPLAWEKVIPGTQCYEGADVRVEMPQIANAQGIILGEILQGLLVPSAAERMPAAKVVELTQ